MSRYLSQIPQRNNKARNLTLYVAGVIFTCKYFKFGLNTTGLSQSHFRNFVRLAPVVQMLDSAIYWIHHYALDNSIGFASVYLLDSNLSGGQRYPSFEQLGPVV